jgi:TolA-binding protein
MAFGVVPGLAHVLLLERTGLGAMFFLLFLAGADAAAAGRYLVEAEWASDLYTAGSVVAAAAWLAAYVDMARLTLLRNYEKRAALRRDWSREGVRHYAAGRLAKAHGSFRACLRLDRRDADALFWYGCIDLRRGKLRRAARAFRRCRKHDHAGKWEFQVGEQEARLAAAERAARGG